MGQLVQRCPQPADQPVMEHLRGPHILTLKQGGVAPGQNVLKGGSALTDRPADGSVIDR